MSLTAIRFILLTLELLQIQATSSNPRNITKISKTDLNLPQNHSKNLTQNNSTSQNFSLEISPKIPEKRNLQTICSDGSKGCKKCSTTTDFCETCDDSFWGWGKPNSEGGCTMSPLATCNIVNTDGTCFICSASYYLACIPCYNAITNCKECKNSMDCDSCLDGYFMDSFTLSCSLCESPCASCTSAKNLCSSCIEGYYLSGTDCKLCSDFSTDCVTCNSLQCTKCIDGKLPNELGTCTSSTISHCGQVDSTNNNNCKICTTGYYWSSPTCEPCSQAKIANCNVCNNDGVTCDECLENYTWDGSACVSSKGCQSWENYDGTECVSTQTCLKGKYWDGAACVSCDIPNCDTCRISSTQVICGKCYPDFVIDENSYCQAYSTTVNNCGKVYSSSPDQCTACLSGYFFDDSNADCHKCDDIFPNCVTCSSYSACGKCKSGYNLNTKKECITTIPLKYCSVYKDTTTCANCITGYANICTSIGSPIDGCKSSTNDGSVCLECNDECKLMSDGSCFCGLDHCEKVNENDETICDACETNYVKNNSGGCACGRISADNSKCLAPCGRLCTACIENDIESCTACVANAELIKDKCSCIANSGYDLTSKSCVCDSGYQLVSNKCISCKNYLALSDMVSAYFDGYFSSITVYFGVKIDTTISAECSNTIDSQSISKLGTGATCSWDGSNKLKIKLGKGFTIRAENLYLQGLNIVKNEGTCNFSYTQIYIAVKRTGDPSPVAIISGPFKYSLDCNNAALQYSGTKSIGNLNNTLFYAWSATITPTNSDLVNYIKKQTSSSISIPKLLFISNIDASLVITLKVANVFGSENSISMITAIKAAPALQVVFDSGVNDTIKSSDSRTYKAAVSQICDSSISLITWEWTYIALEEAPKIDSSAILSASKQSNKLVINKNMLPSGYSYQFNASATSQGSSSQTSVSGYSLLTIKVTTSPLKIKLSRSSCALSSLDGFSINGNGSYDPDNSSTNLTYKWSCLYTNNATSCLGTDNKDLVSLANTSSLSIPSGKMIPGASYDITLVISAGDRNALATISVEVTLGSVASSSHIEIPYSDSKKSIGSYYILSSTGMVSPGSKIKWTCNSTSVTISPDNLSIISIPPNNFIQGNFYKFTFTITESSGNVMSSSIIVTANAGVICDGSVDIQPASGTTLETTFIISIDDCYDQDGQDYPLSYTYNDDWNSIEYALVTSKDNSLSTALFANSNTIKIKVCDQMSDCSTYQSKIIVDKPKRRLEGTDYASMYASATLDPDYIPSQILLIASSASIDNTLFSKMWNDLQSCALSQDSLSVALFKSFAAAVLALSSQTNSMTPTLYENFMNWLANLVSANSIPINTDAGNILKIILSFIDGYLDFASKNTNVKMPFETYLLAANKFLSIGMAYITVDDLAGQSSLPKPDSASSIQYGKIRNFPSIISNTSESFGFINATFSNKIPIDENQVANFNSITYNITNDYSPWFSVSYTTSGSYQDYQYIISNEQYQSFNDDRYPVNISIPYYKNSTKGLSCVYYNTTTFKWEVSGCIIINQGFDTITVSVSHFSLFKITEAEVVPYIPPINTHECGNNLIPTYIMIISFFIGILLIVITIFIEKSYEKKLKQEKKIIPSTELASSFKDQNMTITEMDKGGAEHFNVDTLLNETKINAQTEEDKNEIEKSQLDGKNNTNASVLDPIGHEKKYSEVEFFSKGLYNQHGAKGNSRMLLEGHLTFGLIYYRKDLPRWRRIFVLIIIFISQLLVEGCLFWRFEDTDKGREMSAQSIFENYEANYFGYAALSVFIVANLECVIISWIGAEKSKASNVLALILGISILTGSIIGILIFDNEFCHNWSGYWAESFLWGALMEIFIVQVFYMLIRYIGLLNKSKNAEVRISSEKIIL